MDVSYVCAHMEFHGLDTVNIPWNFHGTESRYFHGVSVDFRGMNTTWYFHGISVAIHGLPMKLPWFCSLEIPWNINGAEAA